MRSLRQNMQQMGINAKAASRELALAPAAQRSLAIRQAGEAILAQQAEILAANQQDMQQAATKNLSAAFTERMALNPERIAAMATALQQIADQADPVGEELDCYQRPNGLVIRKVSVPLGVIGIIYESRPNVTADAAALCLRSANAVILRGGSDALASSKQIFAAMRTGIIAAGLPEHCVQLVPTSNREAVGLMLAGLNQTLDLVIPRGGKSLVARVQADARVPVFSHLEGICHIYVQAEANPQMAIELVFNSKMRRFGICGAAECLLIDRACADILLPKITDVLTQANCELRGCTSAQAIDNRIVAAKTSDWGTEFLAPILAVRVVDDLQQACDHIARYGSNHTESIITENQDIARAFQQQVDSAIVLHNASTQFADGGEFGFGAEIGIATGKLHARGPVGAMQLTSYKYQVDGNGQSRDR
ncbi:Gamma-glutamyl phosphate reductase [hydrothermal vent metagenome]|uniref:glutamate-5-semialdehyde dehydrogenase n=1 Tax=hydrothermal vent metagenome TaxID=652676 RepID=A0A3B0R378_9ZZZZ